jgi:hypothetical protein
VSTIARKRDLKMVDAAAEKLGMTELQRLEFGAYLEDLKEAGVVGSLNDHGDFTWRELLTHGRSFLEDL